MQAILLSNSGFRALPAVLSPAKTSIHGKKIADDVPRGEQLRWPPNSCIIRSEGNRRGPRPPRRVPADKPREEEDELKRRSKSTGNEEILALFRRIQSSISKGGEANLRRRRRRRSHGIPKEQQHSADSVPPILDKQPTRNQPRAERGRESVDGSKVPRPLSKFVKRSPIPVAPPGEKDVEEIEEMGDDSVDVFEQKKKIEDMKLPELKELARAEGIKGFSRLKKGELLQVLKERLQSCSSSISAVEL